MKIKDKEGKEVEVKNADDLKKVLVTLGVSEKNLRDTIGSYLPEGEIEFTSYNVEPFIETNEDGTPKEGAEKKINIILTATQGDKEFKCSLGKLTAFGKIALPGMTSKDVEKATSPSGFDYVVGDAINGFIPSGRHLAVYSLLNKKFNVSKVDVFQVDFNSKKVVAKPCYKLLPL